MPIQVEQPGSGGMPANPQQDENNEQQGESGGMAENAEQQPAECQPNECGPALPVVNYCGDGSTRQQLCQRNADGACTWTLASCAGRNCVDNPTPVCEERAQDVTSGKVRCIPDE